MRCRPLVALLGLACLAGCEEATPARRGLLRLIGDDFSELRYSPPTSLRDKVNLDFTTPVAAQEVVFLSLESEAQPLGLLLTPTTADPMILFPAPFEGFNRVTLEMQSGRPGTVEVFWTDEGESFTAERSERLEISPGDQPVEYAFDLSEELNPSRRYQLRIDPIDGRSPIILRRIAISLSEQLAAPPVACKVRLGVETREALAVASGQTVSRELVVPPDSVLRFGLGRHSGGPEELAFSLWFRDAEGERTVLHEERLSSRREEPAGGRWLGRSVSLERLAGRQGWIEASTTTSAGGDAVGTVFWANPTIRGGPPENDRPNLILISLDTLGSGHLTAYGGEGLDDEFLSRLAREGTVFESSFAVSSLTHVSHGAMLTGTAPLDGDLFWFRGGRLSGMTLAEELRRHGYLTAAFTGGILVTEELGFDRGFEVFAQADTLYQEHLARTDIHQVLGHAERWLEGKSDPWFLFLHTYEVHSPYYPEEAPEPEDYFSAEHMRGLAPVDDSEAGRFLRVLGPDGVERTRDGELIRSADVERLREVYGREIERVDAALEAFFSRLRDRGMLEDTVVVVTADHGEAFFEHHLFEHGLLYDENLRVPLIIVAPGRVAGGHRVEEAVNAADLVPTLLDLLEVEPQEELTGRSLVGAMRGQELAPAPFYAFVPGNGLALDDGTGKKLIWRLALLHENFGRHELFDRVSDPGERRNLLNEPGVSAKRLEEAAVRLVDGLPGLHVDLGAFSGQRCRLEVTGAEVDENSLYAIGLVVAERPEVVPSPGTPWRATVRFGERPRLIVLSTGQDHPVHLGVGCASGSETHRFELRPAAIGTAPGPVVGSGVSATVQAWSIEPREEPTGEFSPEEIEGLRSLGYL